MSPSEEVEEYEKKFPEGTIIDGVVNAEKYFNSKFKIAWFLKELYSQEKGFHMKTYYAPEDEDAYESFFKNFAIPTWHPIIYSSYGIQNRFMKWGDLSYLRDKPEMCDIIKDIAIINANKEPSLTGTYTLNKNLNKGFEKFKELIEIQIKTLQPEIYIFCSTFYLYEDFFKLKNEQRLDNWIIEKDGKLFLEVYHPANRRQKREDYVNKIIGAVEDWAKRNNKN